LPVRRGRQVAARLLTVAALALAVVLVAVLMFGGGDYRVQATVDNASQLVRGNQVKVGGVPVGTVAEIELAPDARARLELKITDDELTPLHEGSSIAIRASSLSGIANRYVSLTPGPSNRDEIPDGGRIPADSARSEVDLDEVLNTLDPATLKDLQTVVRRLGSGSAGRGEAFGRAVHVLNPALSQVSRTEREILRDQRTFERFVVESAQVVSAVASRRPDLEQSVGRARATLDALAAETAALDSSLRRLPPTLRNTNTTLVNVRAAIDDLQPTVRAAQPAARPLTDVLVRLRPIARRARPVVSQLRRVIDRTGSGADLLGILRAMGPLEREAGPALRSALGTVRDALPVLRDARPYVPDLIGGLANGFGGTTGGYYDANGRYARISLHSSVYSLNDEGQLLPTPPTADGLTGYRSGLTQRCPGAGSQTVPDGSNPYLDRADFPCNPDHNPR
jgi:phospholipid/cholesterol/gamma-HCH transport system substrate-binding protein